MTLSSNICSPPESITFLFLSDQSFVISSFAYRINYLQPSKICFKTTPEDNIRASPSHISCYGYRTCSASICNYVRFFSCCFAFKTLCFIPHFVSSTDSNSEDSMDAVPISTGCPFASLDLTSSTIAWYLSDRFI